MCRFACACIFEVCERLCVDVSVSDSDYCALVYEKERVL